MICFGFGFFYLGFCLLSLGGFWLCFVLVWFSGGRDGEGMDGWMSFFPVLCWYEGGLFGDEDVDVDM